MIQQFWFKIGLSWGCVIGVFLACQAQQVYKKSARMMGTHFELTAVAQNDSLARAALLFGLQEIQRIEELISSWDGHSQTSAINQQAGIQAVKVDWELFSLIHHSDSIARLSQGAFDISFAGLQRVWSFDGSMSKLPSDSMIAASIQKLGYQKIQLNRADTSIFLPEKGMRIGFGAIGKGYAADRARKIMQDMGINSGLVDAGGDLICWGHPPGRKSWNIAISDPHKPDAILATIALSNAAIVSSGSTERFVQIDDQRYSHIIDPRTGWPVKGIQMVSVIAADAKLADALATAVSVLGQNEGMTLINQIEGVECLFVNDQNQWTCSKNLKLCTKTSPFTLTYQK